MAQGTCAHSNISRPHSSPRPGSSTGCRVLSPASPFLSAPLRFSTSPGPSFPKAQVIIPSPHPCARPVQVAVPSCSPSARTSHVIIPSCYPSARPGHSMAWCHSRHCPASLSWGRVSLRRGRQTGQPCDIGKDGFLDVPRAETQGMFPVAGGRNRGSVPSPLRRLHGAQGTFAVPSPSPLTRQGLSPVPFPLKRQGLSPVPSPLKRLDGAVCMGLPVESGEASPLTPTSDSSPTPLLNPRSIVIPVAGRQVTVETGRMGRHASGAVTVRDGDTIVYCTVCADFAAAEAGDFAPLSVSYQERFSAAGRTSGGFIKREGRPRDHEVLVARLMDRPIRPMLAKGFNYDTQILAWVLSFDDEHSPDALAIIAAGAALAVSDIPLAGVVAGVRVGLIDGRLVVNPSVADMKRSSLDLVVAGTKDSVLMIEGYCAFLSEEQLLQAVEVGHAEVSSICLALEQWADPEGGGAGKAKRAEGLGVPPVELEAMIEEIAAVDIDSALRVRVKRQRGEAMGKVEQKIMEQLTAEGRAKWRAEEAAAAVAAARAPPPAPAPAPVVDLDVEGAFSDPNFKKASGDDEEVEWEEEEEEESGDVDQGEVHIKSKKKKQQLVPAPSSAAPVPPLTPSPRSVFTADRTLWDDAKDQMYSEADVRRALKTVISRAMRRLIVQEGVRSDGRGVKDVRPIESSCGVLPRTHGSALFSRGETQALCVAVVGADGMAQRMDSLTGQEEQQRFYLHYSFPPSSVGETGRIGAPSRREIGHGFLAQRALEPCIPSNSQGFPYVVRLESNITESNGSSSMASVCGGCLALLDAGVPLVAPVAGVAMGLILDTLEVGGTGKPVVLTDILGSEDALGDMDFKVAGSATGVTAFQMDIKVKGITIEIMREALEQAREGRVHVLTEMSKCYPAPRNQLSPYAPRYAKLKVDPDQVGLIVGSGGKTIRSIIEDSGVEDIDLEDSGEIRIFARNEGQLQIARGRIEALTMTPEVGTVYRKCPVKSLVPFGCFVEIAPGKEGLVHISELAVGKLDRPEDAVTLGQLLDVKLIEINNRGQLRLSCKALLLGEGQATSDSNSPESTGTGTFTGGEGTGKEARAGPGRAENGRERRGASVRGGNRSREEGSREVRGKGEKRAPAAWSRTTPGNDTPKRPAKESMV